MRQEEGIHNQTNDSINKGVWIAILAGVEGGIVLQQKHSITRRLLTLLRRSLVDTLLECKELF